MKQLQNSRGTISAFALTIRDGHTSIIARLFQGGHWPTDPPDETGTHHLAGVLYYAAVDGYERPVRQLLDLGASLGQVWDPDHLGTVVQAASLGQHNIVDLLLKSGAEMNGKMDFKPTALQVATLDGHAKTVRVLMAHAADINDPPDGRNHPYI